MADDSYGHGTAHKPGFLKRLFSFGWDQRLRANSTPKELPLPLPAPPSKIVEPWTLTEQESLFFAQSKKSFRTRAFKNHALPGQPHEYLEADYVPDLQKWRIAKMAVSEARVLPALSADADANGKVPVKSSVILEDDVCVMRALHKMALFEFGTDAQSAHSLREDVVEDLSGSHFIDFAHGEHIIFEINGHPSLTSEGKPVRNGTYPESELQFAAKVYADIIAEKQAAVRLIDLARLEIHAKPQSDDPMKDFEYFASIQAAAGDVLRTIESCKKYYWGERLVSWSDGKRGMRGGTHKEIAFSPLSWSGRGVMDAAEMISAINPALSAVRKMVDLANIYEEEADINSVLRNGALSFVVHNAAFFYSAYQSYGLAFVKLDSVEFSQSLMRETERLMDVCSFDDEKKKSVRAFIMQPREPGDIVKGMEKMSVSLQNLKDIAYRQSLAVLEGQKPKMELPDYRDLTTQFNTIASNDNAQALVQIKALDYTDEEIDRDVKAFHKRMRAGKHLG